MNDDYFDAIEELHSGDTVNLSDVVSDVKKKSKNNNKKNLFSKFKRKDEPKLATYEYDDSYKKDPDVTCRVLFISVLDKILLFIYIIAFLSISFINFQGDISSIGYNFWLKLVDEILIVIIFIVLYYLLNWIYKCANKTILCVTGEQIYRECYFPFKKSYTTLPINKVSSVITLDLFWIFRSVIVLSNNNFPLIFFTWNNQQFKDRVDQLTTGEAKKIRNKYTDKDLINNTQYKKITYLLLVFVGIICILGIVRLFLYFTSDSRKIVGVYSYNDNYINLKKDGKCKVNLGFENVQACSWEYNKDNKEVDINLVVEEKSLGYDSMGLPKEDKKYTKDETLVVAYKKNKLVYNNIDFNKQ